MPSVIQRKQFLTDLYKRSPVDRHALICTPPVLSLWDWPGGDYSISERPMSSYVELIAEQYRDEVKFHDDIGDDGVAIARLMTGTHIFAAAFGAPVHRFTDNNACALPYINTAEEADGVAEVKVFNSPILMRVFELARLMQKELGKDAPLGPCDMQSGFDTACLVWEKSELFMAMYGTDEEKAAVKRLVAKCALTFKQFLTEFRKEFGVVNPCHCPGTWVPPDMGPWLSNDECGALSVEAFEDFCLPELVDLAPTFGGLGMHCCAQAEHQFASFNKIPGFYGFNRVAAQQGYEPILQHFQGKASPVHTLAWIDENTITRLVQLAKPDTRFAFVLMGEPRDKAKAWLERLRPVAGRARSRNG